MKSTTALGIGALVALAALYVRSRADAPATDGASTGPLADIVATVTDAVTGAIGNGTAPATTPTTPATTPTAPATTTSYGLGALFSGLQNRSGHRVPGLMRDLAQSGSTITPAMARLLETLPQVQLTDEGKVARDVVDQQLLWPYPVYPRGSYSGLAEYEQYLRSGIASREAAPSSLGEMFYWAQMGHMSLDTMTGDLTSPLYSGSVKQRSAQRQLLRERIKALRSMGYHIDKDPRLYDVAIPGAPVGDPAKQAWAGVTW